MLGGIIADDMRLGKTLTMITAIMTTIPHAESCTTDLPGDVISVKSTLIIVPSAGRNPRLFFLFEFC